VNIVLSGDNAVGHRARRPLTAGPPAEAGDFLGSGAAIVMRIILTLFAVQLLALPWLKARRQRPVVLIGVKLLVDEEGGDDIESSDNLIAAIKTILIADLVMSLDNVIAVAAAAQGISRFWFWPRNLDRSDLRATLLLKLMSATR